MEQTFLTIEEMIWTVGLLEGGMNQTEVAVEMGTTPIVISPLYARYRDEADVRERHRSRVHIITFSVQPLSWENRGIPLLWTQKNSLWPNENRVTVSFCDESGFGIYSDYRRVCVWRESNNTTRLPNVQEVHSLRYGLRTDQYRNNNRPHFAGEFFEG